MKENQLNTLYDLLNQPKQFIEPKLNRINEENDLIDSPKNIISKPVGLNGKLVDIENKLYIQKMDQLEQNIYTLTKADKFMQKHSKL